jgi:1,6-anhydro-N-acetylmuramate kinase
VTARAPATGKQTAVDAGASTPPVRHVIGVMTGTSIDGIDIALARIEGRGLDMRAALAWHESQGLGELGSRLRKAAEQQPMTAGEFAQLAWDFGLFHADAIAASLKKHQDAPSPDLIVAHGQTIFHQPPISWQLLSPAPIAARFECPVICDLRQADLAVGGQGAPITPLADWVLFRNEKHRRAIVNLGGFCNVTVLPSSGAIDDIRGFDVCACNHILDAVARRALNKPYDKGGEAASGGSVIREASNSLFAVLSNQRDQRRSLGTRDEATSWIDSQVNLMKPPDLAATAVDAIARCIAGALKEHQIDEVILAGGGALNRALHDSIASHTQAPTQRSDALGVPVQAREALCMAVLGALSADGVPITLPQITSCQRQHVAGIRTL